MKRYFDDDQYKQDDNKQYCPETDRGNYNDDDCNCHYPNPNPISLCRTFANILDSQILTSEGRLCVVTRVRNINATIKGIPTRSPLVINALFSFERTGEGDNALNLGETVILQEEINPFITALREAGIKVTALHNHWLFENPRLFYIHWFSIENPIVFARKVAEAFRILENNRGKFDNAD
jgi:hypothetical protein